MLRCITVPFAAECYCHAGSPTSASRFCFGLLSRTQMRFLISSHHFRRHVIVGRVLWCGWFTLVEKDSAISMLLFCMILCVPGFWEGLLDSDFCRGSELCLFLGRKFTVVLSSWFGSTLDHWGLALQRCSIWRRCCPPVCLRCKVTVLRCSLYDRVLCLGRFS